MAPKAIFLKSHVKGHTRRVGARAVFVQDHERRHADHQKLLDQGYKHVGSEQARHIREAAPGRYHHYEHPSKQREVRFVPDQKPPRAKGASKRGLADEKANEQKLMDFEEAVYQQIVEQGDMDRTDAQAVVEGQVDQRKVDLSDLLDQGMSPADAAKHILGLATPGGGGQDHAKDADTAARTAREARDKHETGSNPHRDYEEARGHFIRAGEHYRAGRTEQGHESMKHGKAANEKADRFRYAPTGQNAGNPEFQ